MSELVVPSLISKLNSNHCISTRWVAESSGKSIKHVHEDVKRVLSVKVDKFDLERNQQGRVTAYWLPLAEAIYLMSRYEGERAETAREFVMEAVNYYLHVAPRMEARLAWLESDNATLAANQKRAPTGAKPIRPRRILVPFLVATMHGLNFELRRRAKNECESWQWELGLVPWAVHAIEALKHKIDEAVMLGEVSLLARFLPSELDSEGLHDLFKNLVKDMTTSPERYTKTKAEVLHAC